jgi:hypothetical protein
LRTRWLRGAAALLAIVVAAGVSGCGSVPMPFFGGKKAAEAPGPACPNATILRPLNNTAVFNASGAEPRPANVSWFGIFSDVSAKCTVAGDTLRASLDDIIVAERGPAVRGNDVDLTYFVALTAGDQVLAKKSFAVHVTLAPSAKRGGVNDHIDVAFATGGRPMSDLTITVGFQQSRQALDFYKNFRGR